MTKKVNLTNLAMMRSKQKMTQEEFWARFGITQSAGSRYEAGQRKLSKALRLLMTLYELGTITDADLKKAKKAAGIKLRRIKGGLRRG